MARREYQGAAQATTLASPISPTDVAITLAAATGWPTGAGGHPFYIVIGRGTASEEKVLVASRSLTSLTVSSSANRGADGTTAGSHAAGEAVEHVFTAVDADDANAHVFDTTRDDHSQYLNTTRHNADVHAFGAEFGTPAAASSSAVGDAAAAGTGTVPSRSDHVHGRESFGGAGSTQAFGDAAAAGTATTPSRSDHKHAMPSLAGTGSAVTAAHSDHTHSATAYDTWTGWFAAITTGGPIQMFRSDGAAGGGGSAVPVVAGYAGSLIGLSVALSGTRAAGSLVFQVYINGVAKGPTCTIDGTHTQYWYAVQSSGIDAIAAGDRIDIRYTNSSFTGGSQATASAIVAPS